MRRGLFVNVQRGLGKIDVWKEIVFLVNFGRWDLSCSSEGGGDPYTLYTRWKEPIYCDIFGSREPIQTFIWNRVYRSSNRLHVWEIQPKLVGTQLLKYKRHFHLKHFRKWDKDCNFINIQPLSTWKPQQIVKLRFLQVRKSIENENIWVVREMEN